MKIMSLRSNLLYEYLSTTNAWIITPISPIEKSNIAWKPFVLQKFVEMIRIGEHQKVVYT